jgi:vacuolar-type H+-ATPase subunit I/STV1
LEQELAALLAEETAPAAPPPVDPAGEIERPKSDADERIKGFQRLVSEREKELETEKQARAALEKRLEALELAGMSDTERSSFLTQQQSSEVDRIRQENELLKLRLKNPDVAEPYERLLNARTVDEQIEILRSLFNPKTQTQADEEPVSDVDRNNPITANFGVSDGDFLDDARAEDLLQRLGRGGRTFNKLRGN